MGTLSAITTSERYVSYPIWSCKLTLGLIRGESKVEVAKNELLRSSLMNTLLPK